MGRYTGPKDKIARREGKNIYGTSSKTLKKRLSVPPGGTKQKRATSSYGLQLREKQKVKRMYGLRERQFRNLFNEARKRHDVPTGLALLQLLEFRLDNIVYRLGLAHTRPQARQFVGRGIVIVNGQRVDIPSYKVTPGDAITLTQDAFSSEFIQEILQNAVTIPEWLDVRQGSGVVLRPPAREELDKDVDENLIVAFYTR